MHMKRIAMASVAAMAAVATASQAARTGIAYAGSDGIVADAIAKALAAVGDGKRASDIMFFPCGGSGMPITVQIDSGELPESEITLPECTYKRPGFSFAGWREGGEWYAHEDTEELLQPGDRTAARPYFHAVWVPDGSQINDGETYLVRFLGAASSSLDEDATVSYLVDEPVLLPSIEQHVHRDDEPAIMRSSCIGWRDTATGEMYSNSQIQMNIGTGERVIELEAVYGSPWDGKHHLSRNASAPLKAIVNLQRDRTNHIEQMSRRDAFLMLLRQRYTLKDDAGVRRIIALQTSLLDATAFYRMYCNMETEAARIAWKGVSGT